MFMLTAYRSRLKCHLMTQRCLTVSECDIFEHFWEMYLFAFLRKAGLED